MKSLMEKFISLGLWELCGRGVLRSMFNRIQKEGSDTLKDAGGEWEECVEWDEETGECTKTEPYYMDCYEIEVYRIGRCYDDLDDFKEFVYSKCPDITPPYPDLWQTWYGNKYPSTEAEECIYKEWDLNQDSWYSYAYYRYIPKAIFHWKRYDCSVRVDTNSSIGHEVETGRYTWCDGECLEYDENWDCINCDGEMQEEIMYDWVEDGYAHIIQKPAWGGSDVWTSTWELCEWNEGDPECKCISAYNVGSAAAFADLNSEVEDILGDESEYWIGEETNNAGTCFNKSYSSRFEPNECWASWIVEGINRKYCYFGELTIEKWDNRVTYSGVKLKVYAIQKNGASQGNGDPTNYPLSVDHTSTVLYDQEVEVYWGDTISFPLVDNMIGFSIYDPGYCVNFGDYSMIRYYPYDSGCENCSTVEIHIEVLDRI